MSFGPPVSPVDRLRKPVWKAKALTSITPLYLCSTEMQNERRHRCWVPDSMAAVWMVEASAWWSPAAAVFVPRETWSLASTGLGRPTLSWRDASYRRCGVSLLCQHCFIFHLAEKEDAFKVHAWILTPVPTSSCCVSLLSIAGWATAGRRALVSLFGGSRHNRPHCTVRSEGEGQYHQRGQSDHGGEWCGWGLWLHRWTGKYSKLQNWVYKCCDFLYTAASTSYPLNTEISSRSLVCVDTFLILLSSMFLSKCSFKM